MDRSVKKVSGSWSLVHGSAGEERIWVAGAWFMDWPVKKGTGRGAWFMDCWSLVFERERERER